MCSDAGAECLAACMLELLVGMCLHGVLIALMSKGVDWASWHKCGSLQQGLQTDKAVNNHWTGLLDWTTGLDYWTINLTKRFQLRSKKFHLKSNGQRGPVLALKL